MTSPVCPGCRKAERKCCTMSAKEELIEIALAVAKAGSRVYENLGCTDESIKIVERLDAIALELFAYVRRLK